MNESVTIPLKEYVELLVGTKQFAIVSTDVAWKIGNVTNNASVCVLENEDRMYTDMFGSVLPKLDGGLCRLWLRSTFDAADNNRRRRQAERNNAQAYYAALQQTVAEHMSKMMNGIMTVDLAKAMLVNATRETLETTLRSAGVALPVVG